MTILRLLLIALIVYSGLTFPVVKDVLIGIAAVCIAKVFTESF